MSLNQLTKLEIYQLANKIIRDLNNATARNTSEVLKLKDKMSDIEIELKKQTKINFEIQILTAKAEMTEASELLNIERDALISVEYKLAQSKHEIFQDFVKGIRDNIIQFKNLVKNELERLNSIIAKRNMVKKLFQNVNPMKDDRELLQETGKIFKNRKNLVIKPILEASNQISGFVEERRNLKAKIENLFISNRLENIDKNAQVGDIFIIETPIWVAGYTSQSIKKSTIGFRSTSSRKIISNLRVGSLEIPSKATVPEELNSLSSLQNDIVKILDNKDIKNLIDDRDLFVNNLNNKFESIRIKEPDKSNKKVLTDFYMLEDL